MVGAERCRDGARHRSPEDRRPMPGTVRARTKVAARSEPTTVVGPVQERLALTAMTVEVARFAGLHQLRDVATHCAPAADLARVVGVTAAHVVAAVPLEPPAWIVAVDP